MKKLTLLLTIGALMFVAVSVAFASTSAAASETQSEAAFVGGAPLLQDVTPTPTVSPDTAAAPDDEAAASMVELWDQFCVRKIPYTLLAIPENATFEVVVPEGTYPTPAPGYFNAPQYACTSVLTINGQQVLVCTGPQLYSFTLRVTDGGTTEDFSVPLKACPLPREPRE